MQSAIMKVNEIMTDRWQIIKPSQNDQRKGWREQWMDVIKTGPEFNGRVIYRGLCGKVN